VHEPRGANGYRAEVQEGNGSAGAIDDGPLRLMAAPTQLTGGGRPVSVVEPALPVPEARAVAAKPETETQVAPAAIRARWGARRLAPFVALGLAAVAVTSYLLRPRGPAIQA